MPEPHGFPPMNCASWRHSSRGPCHSSPRSPGCDSPHAASPSRWPTPPRTAPSPSTCSPRWQPTRTMTSWPSPSSEVAHCSRWSATRPSARSAAVSAPCAPALFHPAPSHPAPLPLAPSHRPPPTTSGHWSISAEPACGGGALVLARHGNWPAVPRWCVPRSLGTTRSGPPRTPAPSPPSSTR